MPTDSSDRHRSRRNVLKTLGIAGAVGLAGCSGSGGGDTTTTSGGDEGGGGTPAPTTTGQKQVEIEFWDYFGGTEDAELKALIKEFEKKHPNITVKTQAVPFSDMISKLTTAAATGNTPHVASYWMSFSTFFEQKGIIDPVDEYLSDGLKPYYDIVEPAAKAGGNVVALPMDIHGLMLATNDTVLEKAGAPMEPTTEKEFREAANAIKNNTDARPFFLQKSNNQYEGFRRYYSLIRQHGGQMIKDGKPIFQNTDAGMKAAQWQDNVTGKWNWDDPSDISDSGIRINEFKNNEAGMGFLGNWDANSFQDKNNNWLDLDFTYHPPWGFGGSTKQTFCESNGFFFPSNSSHTKAEKKARVTFVEWITQNNPLWATKGTHLPSTPEVATSERVTSAPIYEKYNIVKTLQEMASNGNLRYQPRAPINLYAAEIGQPLSSIYAQDLKPKEALTKSANAIKDRWP